MQRPILFLLFLFFTLGAANGASAAVTLVDPTGGEILCIDQVFVVEITFDTSPAASAIPNGKVCRRVPLVGGIVIILMSLNPDNTWFRYIDSSWCPIKRCRVIGVLDNGRINRSSS